MKELYTQYHELLGTVARHYISNPDDANDVEHDAWIIIFSSLHTLRNSANLKNWMCHITRNVALNHIKHQQSLQRLPLTTAETVAVVNNTAAPDILPMEEILQLVERLPNDYEQVFRLRIFEGMTHRQIAQQLGISEGSSRLRLLRARDQLKKLVRQHWALLLTLLLLPMGFHLLTMRDNHHQEASDTQLPERQSPSILSTVLPTTSANSVFSAYAPPASRGRQDIVAVAPLLPDTITTSKADAIRVTLTDVNHVSLAQQISTTGIQRPLWSQKPPMTAVQKPRHWTLHLGYGGAPSGTSTAVNNFLTLLTAGSSGAPRTVRVHNWTEYQRYVDDNTSLLNPDDAYHMTQLAAQHTDEDDLGDDSKHLQESKKHSRPFSLQLSLSVPLNNRWSLNTGVGYTYLKSVFEADDGNGNDFMRRTQRLHYIGVPLGVTYNIWQKNRWTVYSMASLRLDVPVKGRVETKYIYKGPFAHTPGDSLVFPTTHSRITPPWQFSVGAGLGVQYRLMPHVNVYFEPAVHYYIPTGSAIENYRSAHPIDLSLPVGIRITP